MLYLVVLHIVVITASLLKLRQNFLQPVCVHVRLSSWDAISANANISSTFKVPRLVR